METGLVDITQFRNALNSRYNSAVYYNTAQIGYGHNGKQYGFSVRCVKNP
jgi:hypothetical protein